MALGNRYRNGIKKVMMTIELLLATGREIWGPPPIQPTLSSIVVRMVVTVGDLSRAARNGFKSMRSEHLHTLTDEMEVKKELGNLILSTIRWCDDLGFDPIACIQAAITAQRNFVASGKTR